MSVNLNKCDIKGCNNDWVYTINILDHIDKLKELTN